ncbi:phospholipid-transporting ATPase ABCA3-like isoform X2 [Ruditapes philippinarum]|uniref:phospholipid-transporting ATPase ABCA3-like isoform X2 n=1 Tax=Ruditapes philippinarum TaxID=129788 RepID=UPI00295B08BC|nr:phospholipid-transporting ATPase ABCA3-like isoform X2 [Ruditapes philippinarum]
MSSAGGQFLLLLWKNFKLQGRKKVVTVFEILVPVFFALLLLLIRNLADSEYIDNDTKWDSAYPELGGNITGKTVIFYTPNTTFTDEVIQSIIDSGKTAATNKTGFASEQALLDDWNTNDNTELWAAVVFTSDVTTNPPDTLDYKLRVTLRKGQEDEDRWRTANTYQFFSTFGYRNNESTGGEPYYYETGFLALQYFIDKAFIEKHSANSMANIEVGVKKMLYPPFLQDVLATVLQTNLPLFLVLGFILNALQMSMNIAYEKEKKLKESMKMMGLKTSIYWLSWFVKNLIYLVLVCIFYTIIFNIKSGEKGKILNYTHPTIFFVFLLLYVIATIAFCFMISTFFSKAFSAAFAGGILFFLTYFPYFFLRDQYETMSQSEKMAACLLHNVGMAFGINTMLIYEGTGDGAQWNNFYAPGTIDDNFSLLDAMVMLLVDTVLYMVIAWYVDNVNPGDAGVAQPLWFPFLPSYWCGSKVEDSGYENNGDGSVNSEHFERDPQGSKVGISIRHLRKVFGGNRIKQCFKKGNSFKDKVAVNDTNLNMFEGQITSLLGHNGAGKTTTISMLTGFLEPTSGTALIDGKDIRTDINSVRKYLGLCPQHNILFDLLTVEEHLIFFAKLKGCPSKDVDSEVNEMIQVLGLEQKRSALSQTLSGGQKRKLSVGIALIAGSKVVILDEPTSGMDPAARRQTWDILQRYRQGRTIILTTHFMDEADILGDRIAIMADGVVKCSGTSMFLKKLYGAGYHMVVVKGKTCDVDRLTKLVQSHIPTAFVESQISAEVSYLLPFTESPKFEKLFTEIEAQMSNLGVNSFGVSATTMEEVFLKVGEGTGEDEAEEPENIQNGGNTNPAYGSTTKLPRIAFEANSTKSEAPFDSKKLPPIGSPEKPQVVNDLKNGATNGAYYNDGSVETIVAMEKKNYAGYNQGVHKNTGLSLAMQQFYGMFVKKFIQARRNLSVAVAQLLLPVVFTVMALAVEKAIPNVGDEPALALNLGPFSDYTVAFSNGSTATATTESQASFYSGQFGGNTVKVDRSRYTEMDDYFKYVQDDIGTSTFNRRYIVAGDFEDSTPDTATAHYNGQPYHSIAIALHYTMNGLLKQITGDSTKNIKVINHPLPKKINDNSRRLFFSTNGTGFTIAISVLFGMAFMATSFIIFLIKERSVGAKHLQVVSGVGPFAYWSSTFVWDIINYTIPVLIILVIFAAFQTDAYVSGNRLGIVFLIFMLYGWAVLPFVYLLHFLFMIPSRGMVVVSMINLCSGLVFLLATYTLSIPQLGTQDIGKALEVVFIIFLPNYDLGLALMDMYTNAGYKDTCEGYNYKTVCAYIKAFEPYRQDPCCFPDHCPSNFCFEFFDNFLAWEKPGIGRECLFMLLQGVVYFIIVLLIEFGVFTRLSNMLRNRQPVAVGSQVDIRGQQEDGDVAEEKRRINDTPVDQLMKTDSLILKNVNKIYRSGFQAVKGVSCGIPANECFGLLGQNGAGKTTTFKMMTGDESLTTGNAYLNRFSVKGDIKQVQQNLGYCPQFDALIDQMTGTETLYMYARLRGISEDQIQQIVDQVIDILMLRKHADKQAGFYSGGNKRKLSTAIALIGDPPFIFLDEPTTGMDPGARRQLWNVLSDVRASGRTLVLTSHSMEECDALCTRIVIMVNGRFVCLGSPQHLKNKFGHGYTLFCRMGLNEAGFVSGSQGLIDFLKLTFPDLEVFDDNQGYIHFRIPDDNAKLGQIFGVMERAKDQFCVDDYSVHQTTLEQIFLAFTQNQVPPAESKKGCCSGGCLCFGR